MFEHAEKEQKSKARYMSQKKVLQEFNTMSFQNMKTHYNSEKPLQTKISSHTQGGQGDVETEKNAGSPCDIIQAYWSEAFPMTEHNMQLVRRFVDELERPHFRTEVKNEIFSYYYVGGQNFPVWDETERKIIQVCFEGYRCHNCGKVLTRGNLQIGHIMNWRNYLVNKGVCNIQEAQDMYNDIENLRVECPDCNQSHNFELGAQQARLIFKRRVLEELEYDVYNRVPGLTQQILYDVIDDIILNVENFTISEISDYISNAATTGIDLDANASSELAYVLKEAMCIFLHDDVIDIG